MRGFVDSNKAEYGVEPICNEIRIARSHPAGHEVGICHTTDMGRQLPGLWCSQSMAAVVAGRHWHCSLCTVARLMKKLGIHGIRRGKKCRTTLGDDLLDRPTDKVNRQFVATRPNPLWGADITFVATWIGFVYVAFITDVFARYIVGWRVSRSLRTDRVLDALEQALWFRKETAGQCRRFL